MRKHALLSTLWMIIFSTSCQAKCTTGLSEDNIKSDTKNVNTFRESNDLTRTIVDVDTGIVIQNSLPRGGLKYIDPTGKRFVYAVFWTRVINETATSLEIKINFPAGSFTMQAQPNTFFNLLLPPDKMTPDKEPLFDYGLTGLNFFLDNNLHKPTLLQRTIQPKEEYSFYVVTLFNQGVNGVLRAALVLQKQDLFYKIAGEEIPCGHITVKN
jgi:hypothetical protein